MLVPCPAPEVCGLFLIRHGATDNNLRHPPVLQGRRSDPPLSAAGIEQAQACGQFLAAQPLAAIYASPMMRARQTAEALLAGRSIQTKIEEAIIECDLGQWEGRSWPEIEQAEPEAFRAFTCDPELHPYAGGESLGDVARRVLPAIHELAARHLGECVAVVAHNVVNRVILAQAMHIPMAKARTIQQYNGGINLLAWKDGRLLAISTNSSFHLPLDSRG